VAKIEHVLLSIFINFAAATRIPGRKSGFYRNVNFKKRVQVFGTERERKIPSPVERGVSNFHVARSAQRDLAHFS